MNNKFRTAICIAVLILVGIISVVIYFKIIDNREQIVCRTLDKKISMNFGRIENVYCRYYGDETTFIFFQNAEDKQNFIDNYLITSKYFYEFKYDTHYFLIKDGYVFDFETYYDGYIVCSSYKKIGGS